MPRFLLAIPLLLLAARLTAQSADSATTADTVFQRVQRLAANGQGDAARALVQQEFEAAPTASARFVEAMYWRAVVAATAADAERDLRTIIVDYPLSPWSVEALMRLAQLEMTRGDMDQALAHLQRVLTEHPGSAARPRASFWIARVKFEQGKVPEACRQLADASSTTPAAEAELRNQIEYWTSRCVGVDTAASAALARADSVKKNTAAVAPPPAPPPAPVPAAAPVRTAAPSPAPAAAAAAAPTVMPTVKRQYSVQVAAYNTKSAADALARSLRDKGYDARVFGGIAPFRVRIGRFDRRTQADSLAQTLNAKKIAGFVTEAEPR